VADLDLDRRCQLLAEIRRTGGAWTTGMAWTFYRNQRLAPCRTTARLDLAYWTRRGLLTQRGRDDARTFTLNHTNGSA
jgi:hypothetical protein